VRIRRAACSFVTGLAATAFAGPALAAGFYTAKYTGEHGHPVTDNATSIYFNPGAMTRGKGPRLLVDVNVALRSISYEHQRHSSDVPEPAGYENANVGKAEALNVLAGPTLGFITNFDKLALGVLIHGPFGGAVQFDQDDRFENTGPYTPENPQFAGPVDSVARYSVVTASLASVYVSAGGAYEVADGLSFGAALNLIYSTVETTRAQNITGTNDLTTEGRTSLKVNGLQWSFGLGMMIEAIENRLWLGASYQAQPNVSGGMVLEGEQRTKFVNTNGSAPERVQDAELHQTYPDVVRAGLAFRAQPLLELRLFGDWQRWSVLKDQCVGPAGKNCETGPNGQGINGSSPLVNARRNWQDTFGVRVGASYWTTQDRDLELFGGAGFESNAAPDATLVASLHDANKISASLGARVGLSKSFHVAGSYTHLHYLDRDNRNKSELSQFQGATKTPDAGGIYKSWIGIFNVNAELAF
jgi:long-chain fatty acid transport protein